jgi:DNA-binding NtrC family response regulator
MKQSVLILDDKPEWVDVIQNILEGMDIDVVTTRSRVEAERELDVRHFALVILDVQLDEDADLGSERAHTASMLMHLEQHHKGTKCVILTAHATLPFALQMFREFKLLDLFIKDDFGDQIDKFQLTVRRALDLKNPAVPTVHGERSITTTADWLPGFELEKRKQELLTQLIECLKNSEDQLMARWSKRVEAKGGQICEADAAWLDERKSALEARYREASARVQAIEKAEDIGPTSLWLTKECNQWLGFVIA